MLEKWYNCWENGTKGKSKRKRHAHARNNAMRKLKKWREASARTCIITICVAIVDGAECVEALLPGRVPDSEIDGSRVDVQPLAQKGRCTIDRMKK
jgi:hypothetical protein